MTPMCRHSSLQSCLRTSSTDSWTSSCRTTSISLTTSLIALTLLRSKSSTSPMTCLRPKSITSLSKRSSQVWTKCANSKTDAWAAPWNSKTKSSCYRTRSTISLSSRTDLSSLTSTLVADTTRHATEHSQLEAESAPSPPMVPWLQPAVL